MPEIRYQKYSTGNRERYIFKKQLVFIKKNYMPTIKTIVSQERLYPRKGGID